MAYFDNNATTAISPRARQRMSELQDQPANANSPHGLGRRAAAVLESARDTFARALSPLGRVIFTSGASEANALALLGTLQHADCRCVQLIVNDLEHSSVWDMLQTPCPRPVVSCQAATDGRPDLHHLADLLGAGPSLVSMMHVNNETGIVFPIRQAAALTHAGGGLLHVDVAQSLGKIDLAEVLACSDIVTFSAHKFHGPLGVGGLACRPEHALRPLWPGGYQEGGVRSGTINVPAIAAAAVALQEILEQPPSHLLKRLEQHMREYHPACHVVGGDTERIWTTTCICFAGLLHDDLIAALSRRDVYVSAGSACSSGLGRSRVLSSMGLSPLLVESGIRFSIARTTSDQDLEQLLRAFPEAFAEAMQRSPYGAVP